MKEKINKTKKVFGMERERNSIWSKTGIMLTAIATNEHINRQLQKGNLKKINDNQYIMTFGI